MADREPDIRLGQFTERAEEYVGRGIFESIDEVVEKHLMRWIASEKSRAGDFVRQCDRRSRCRVA